MSANGDRDPIDFLEEAQGDGPVEGAPEQDGPRTRQTRASPERRREIEQELQQAEEASQGPDFEPRTPSEDVGRRRIQATQAPEGPAEVQPVPADELSPLTLMTLEGDQVRRATRGATEVRRRAERGDIAAQVFDIGRQVGAAGAGVAEGVVSTLDRGPGITTGVSLGPYTGGQAGGEPVQFSETAPGVVTQEVVEDVPVAVGGAIQAPSAVAGTLGQAQEDPTGTGGRVAQQAIQGGQTQARFAAENPVAAGLLLAPAIAGRGGDGGTPSPEMQVERIDFSDSGGLTGGRVRPDNIEVRRFAEQTRQAASETPRRIGEFVESVRRFQQEERGQVQVGRQQPRQTAEQTPEPEQTQVDFEFQPGQFEPARPEIERVGRAQDPSATISPEVRAGTAGLLGTFDPAGADSVLVQEQRDRRDQAQQPGIDETLRPDQTPDVRVGIVATPDTRQEPQQRQDQTPEQEQRPEQTPDITPDPQPEPDRRPRPDIDFPDQQAQEEEEDPLARFLFGERQLEFDLQGAEDLI